MSMTVAQAAKVFREKKPELDRLEAEVEQAKEVLKEYFRKNEKRKYRNLISYASWYQRRYDFDKLREHLGDQVEEFKRPVLIETVSIIPKDAS